MKKSKLTEILPLSPGTTLKTKNNVDIDKNYIWNQRTPLWNQCTPLWNQRTPLSMCTYFDTHEFP